MIADAAISELSVLVVDDEPLARERLVKMLRSLGVKSVEQFGDGDACLQHYQTSGAQVVLLDIEMPGTPGVAVAEKLAMLDPAPVVIFCTAYDNYALQAFDASATDYLLKPVAKDRLEKALQKAVAVRPEGAAESSPADSEGVPDHIWVSKALGRQRIELADIRYLYADAGSGEVFGLRVGADRSTESELLTKLPFTGRPGICTVTQVADEIIAIELGDEGGTNGALYRLVRGQSDMAVQGVEVTPERLYALHCTRCHDSDGRGTGLAAGSGLADVERDFTDPTWQDSVTDAQILSAIRDGVVERGMPAWQGIITDDEIEALVPVVRGFRRSE